MQIHPQKANKKKSGRNLPIDVARLFFIFTVFIHHTVLLAPDRNTITPLMYFGYLGVEFFFILSGYLMALKAAREKQDSYRNKEIGQLTVRFIWRKYTSIFPYYITAWVFSMILLNWGDNWLVIITRVFRAVPCVLWLDMAGFDGYQAMAVGWYLSAMLLSMMILYPLLLRYQVLYTKLIAPTLVIWCYGFLFLKVGNLGSNTPVEGGFVYTGFLRGIAGISLGAFCYEVAEQVSKLPLNHVGGSVLAVIEICSFALAIFITRTQRLYHPDFLFVCLAAVGITAAFSRNNPLPQRFNSSNTWIGRYSLSFYFADPVGRAITMRFFPESSWELRILYSIVITAIVALVIFWLGSAMENNTSKWHNCMKTRLVQISSNIEDGQGEKA